MSQEEKSQPLPIPKKISTRVHFDKPTLSLMHVEQLITLAREEDMLSGEVLHRALMDLKKLKVLGAATFNAWDAGDEEELVRLLEIMGVVAMT